MTVSKLLVSGLLCGTLLASPAAKANLLADIGKYFLIGTGIYGSYRAVKAAAEKKTEEVKAMTELIRKETNREHSI